MTWWLTALGLLMATACAPGMDKVKSSLQLTDSGTIWFLTDRREVLSGELTFPTGPEPFSVVVLMHGCNGFPSHAIQAWDPLLRSWGYATFVLDSFGGRGLKEVCTDAFALTANQRIPDAYGALKVLATHPRVDRSRIALMGFSHGGLSTLGAATEWAWSTYGADGVGFRAFLPFHPYCNAVVPEIMLGFAAPVRIHIGELDDWTPARTCVSLVREARSHGADIEIIVYKNAMHAFDSVGLSVQRWPNVQNAADCTPRLESMNGPILNLFELWKCMRNGATLGWNPEAAETAQRNVRVQLAEFLK